MMRDDREGRIASIEMLTTRTSISEGEIDDFVRSFAMLSSKNSSISKIPSFNVGDPSRPSKIFLGA
ncbi:hypothetical protein TSUD_96660 [Trifolium subterraneum]|nr:hypothetical protein TSUD_96660 [Trifolium subterraneum]